MPQLKNKTYTTDDIYNLPEGQRAELVDGELYMMAPPSRMHQKISYQLSRTIGNHIQENKGSCEVYTAPFAVFLSEDNKNYVEPDICIICDKNKLTDRGCCGSPDWIIEIVSPSSQRMDYMTKLFKYRTAGVREYWIVNPMKQTVQTYFFEGEEDSCQYSFEDSIPVRLYDNLTIRISDFIQ